jgi:receptor expression-enhancing protein 5/6
LSVLQSYKALKTVDSEDDSHWLTYWVVFGFLSLLESFSAAIVMW